MKIHTTSRLPFLATASFILLFSGCVLYQNVSTESPLKVNFSDYHRYGWLAMADSCDKIPDTLPISEVVEGSVEQELDCRGYSFDSEQPDLLLRIAVCHKKMEKYPNYLYPWSFANDNLPVESFLPHYQVASFPVTFAANTDFLESTITLFVYESKHGRLIWCASAVQEVYDVSEAISVGHQSVKTLMEKFPVKPLPEKMVTL